MALFLISLCLLGVSPEGRVTGARDSDWGFVDSAFELNVLNVWEISWAYHALGLATWENGSTVSIVFVNNVGNELNSLNPATGGSAGAVPKPAAAQDGFGVAYNGSVSNSAWYINSWQNTDLHYSEDNFSTWQTVPNPAGSEGRGMSCDGVNYYQGHGTSVTVFVPGGSHQTFNEMAPDLITGVAVVPGPSDETCVMTTCYDTDVFMVFSYNGSAMTPLGYAFTPSSLSVFQRLGITWCPNRNSLFFSYQATSAHHRIAELEIDYSASLTNETWGAIKSAF